MPQLGETVADGTVARWFKSLGDKVEKGEPLFEVSTDKVDTEIPAQATGVLSAIYVQQGETVDVGTVVATISEESETTAPTPLAPNASATKAERNANEHSEPASGDMPSKRTQLSPAVRKLLLERGVDAAKVLGTGPGGRITKEDVLNFADSDRGGVALLSPVVRRLLAERGLDVNAVPASSPGGRVSRRDVEAFIAEQDSRSAPPESIDEVVPFTRIRRLTAEHMVRSKAVSAHTLMVREIDYEAVERVRKSVGPIFKEQEGYSLTYLPFCAFAAVQALQDFPHLNASVGDNALLVHKSVNLGIAVDLRGDGLVVPVILEAQKLGLRDLARTINKRASDARGSNLSVDDFAAGTFTITNPGPFGTLMTGAVINQPQVAILSTDGVTRRPVVVTDDNGDESIAVHSIGLLALTFDHRAVDGAYAARYLQSISKIIDDEKWSDLLR